jgi:hypothetical protein
VSSMVNSLKGVSGSVNLIWPLLIFSFGPTPFAESSPARRLE